MVGGAGQGLLVSYSEYSTNQSRVEGEGEFSGVFREGSFVPFLFLFMSCALEVEAVCVCAPSPPLLLVIPLSLFL